MPPYHPHLRSQIKKSRTGRDFACFDVLLGFGYCNFANSSFTILAGSGMKPSFTTTC